MIDEVNDEIPQDHGIQQLQEDAENIVSQFFAGVPYALKMHRNASPPPSHPYLSRR